MSESATSSDASEPDLVALRSKYTSHHTEVYRRGDIVKRETGPWAPTVHSLLRHLESVDFPTSRVVGSGFDEQGRETVRYIEGEFTQTGLWSLGGVFAVGKMLRDLHDAMASYSPPTDAMWSPWFGRDIGWPGPRHRPLRLHPVRYRRSSRIASRTYRLGLLRTGRSASRTGAGRMAQRKAVRRRGRGD